MSGARVLETDDARITPLDRTIHEALPGAEVAAWRGGPGDEAHDEQRAEEQGRERDIARQGWSDHLFVPAVRAKLESLFGAPPSRGDDYKLSFEYPLRVETPAGTVLLSVGDWKSWGVVLFQEYSTSTPEARRLARRAVWRAIADASLADFEDRFGYDEAAGVAYGCRGGHPWVDTEALGANVRTASEEGAELDGPRRRARRRMLAAAVLAGVVSALVRLRWGGWAGLGAGAATWIVVQHGVLALQRALQRRR